MKKCPKCGKEVPEKLLFCEQCGERLVLSEDNGEKAKKTSNKKYIYVVIAILLVIAILSGVWLIAAKNKKREAENEQKLLELLETSTTKPVVEFICEDFDKNGTIEAFAVVGQIDNSESDHPEYSNADFFYIYEEAEIIKEDVYGKSNGIIECEEVTYVSFEVYEENSNEGYSFIYTAADQSFEEADISGKYSDVHEENGEIVAFDNGKQIDVSEFLIKKDNTDGVRKENNIIQPTKEDWKMLGEYITQNQTSRFNLGEHILEDAFDVNSPDAVTRAYNYVSGFCGISNVYCYFYNWDQDMDAFEAKTGMGDFAQPDPLKMFKNNPVYYRYSADKIDWIIENVFNLKPDRSFSRCDDENYVFYYYYGDYFYIGGGYAGDIGFEYKVENKTELDDGKYKVEIYGYNNYISEEDVNYGTLSNYYIVATVALKEVDGRRFWSFYSYEWAENK